MPTPQRDRPEIELTVTSLGSLGDGLATHGGKTVFIPKACAGDRVRVRIVHENRDGLQAAITQVLEPGLLRQAAPCPYFDACGGCTMQQLVPDAYRGFKTRLLRQALERAGFGDAPADCAFAAPGTRRRVEFKLSRAGANPELAFHGLHSHDAVAINECLLLTPALHALIAPLNDYLAQGLPADSLYSVGLTDADVGLDMLLTFSGTPMPHLPALDDVAQKLGISRISARLKDGRAWVAHRRGPVEMVLAGAHVPLPPDAFLQATREGQAWLTRIALEAAAGAEKVVDLFCGIGSYSIPLAQSARVLAVELDTAMVDALIEAAKNAGVKTLSAGARDLFRQPLTAAELAGYGAAIINPPRLGARAQCEQIAASGISRVGMISCNPATFARDVAILKKAGFSMQRVQAMDQFLWSRHLEIAAVMTR
jgi:23S rRNA (uracil1939-C5)-methyltransferase